MITLVRDGGDDGRLLVGKPMAGDSRTLTDSRTGTVGRHEKTRGARLAIG